MNPHELNKQNALHYYMALLNSTDIVYKSLLMKTICETMGIPELDPYWEHSKKPHQIPIPMAPEIPTTPEPEPINMSRYLDI